MRRCNKHKRNIWKIPFHLHCSLHFYFKKYIPAIFYLAVNIVFWCTIIIIYIFCIFYKLPIFYHLLKFFFCLKEIIFPFFLSLSWLSCCCRYRNCITILFNQFIYNSTLACTRKSRNNRNYPLFRHPHYSFLSVTPPPCSL